MRIALFAAATALALLLVPGSTHAQEVQVHLDEEGQILELDRDVAERLGLFIGDYPELRIVRLFQATEGAYFLEVEIRRDGRIARYRVPMDEGDVRALRARVAGAVAGHAPGLSLDQDGRFLLLGTSTLLGVGYYGWAVPVLLDIQSGRGILATYMLTAGASFVAPYLYTRGRPVTYGMANAGFWGATRGLSHGAYLANLLANEPSERLALGSATAFSVGEGLLGYEWARHTGMSAGEVHTIGNFGDYGTAAAGAIMLVAQPDDDRVTFGSLLAGSVAGLGAGARLAPGLPYTWGDAEIQRAGFFLGAAHGGMVFDWFFDEPSDDDLRVLGGLLLAGSGGGAYTAHRLLDGHDFSAGEGILLDLGTVAGGLLGMGLAVLLGPENVDDPTGLFTMGVLGADAGFAATFLSLSDNARRRAEREAVAPADGPRRLELDFNPGALMLLRHRIGPEDGPEPRLPLLSLQYRF